MEDTRKAEKASLGALKFHDRAVLRILILLGIALGVTRVLLHPPSGDHGIVTDWAQKYLETGEFIQFELNGYLIFFKPIVFLLSVVIDVIGSSPVAVLAPNLLLVALLVAVLWTLVSKSTQPGWAEVSLWVVLLALSLDRMFWPRPEFIALLMTLVFACYFETDTIKHRRLVLLNALTALSVSIHPIFVAYPLYFVYLLLRRAELVEYLKFLVTRPIWGIAVVASCGLAIFLIVGTSIDVWLDGLHRNWQDPAHGARTMVSEARRYLQFSSFLPILLTLPLAIAGLWNGQAIWRRFDYLHHFAIGYATLLLFQPAIWGVYLVPLVPLYAAYVAHGYRIVSAGQRLPVILWLVITYGIVAIASQASYKTFQPMAPDAAYVTGISCIMVATLFRMRVTWTVVLLAFLVCTYRVSFPPRPYDLTQVNEVIAGKTVMSTVRALPFHLPPETKFFRFDILNHRYMAQNAERIESICRETDYVLLRDVDLVYVAENRWHPLASEIVNSATILLSGHSNFLGQSFHLYQIRPNVNCGISYTGD